MTDASEFSPTAPAPGLRQLFTGMLMVALSAFGGGLSEPTFRPSAENHHKDDSAMEKGRLLDSS